MANTQTMTYQPIHLLSTTNSCNNRTAKKPTVHIIFISAPHFYLTGSQSNDKLLVRITGLKQCMILLLANRKIFTFCRFHLAISDINTPNFVTKINPCVTAHGVIRWWQQHSLSDLWHQVCTTDSTEWNTVPISFVQLEKKHMWVWASDQRYTKQPQYVTQQSLIISHVQLNSMHLDSWPVYL